MARNLIDLPPYIPLRGVNLDEDSLLLDQSMCLGIENLRIEGHQISQRPSIQQYGVDQSQKEDAGLIIGTTPDPAVTPIDLTPHTIGSSAVTDIEPSSVAITWTDATVLWTITDDGTGGLLDADLNAVGTVDYTTGAMQITVWASDGIQYSPNPATNSIIYATAGIAGGIAYPYVNDRAILMKLFREPEQDVLQFYFLGDDIVKYNETTQTFESILDAGVVFSDITLWSAVQFTDTDIGATMVACGTNPPDSAMGDETDGATRELLYYDKDSATFKDLEQYMELDSATGDIIEDGEVWLPIGVGQKVLTAVALPPIKVSSAIIYWADSDYTWELTTDASSNVLDPDGNIVGVIDYNTGIAQLTAMPKRSSGLVTYVAGSSNTPADIWISYDGLINKKPRFVFNLNNRVIMVNIYNSEWNGTIWTDGEYQPWRVRWTELLNIFAQDITADYTDNVGGDISPYVAGEHIGDILILYRYNSIEQMYYVGGDKTFGFKTSQNVGIYAGQTVARHNSLHYYFGKNDVYVYDGNTAKSIASRRIIKYLRDNTDEDLINRFLGFVDPIEEQYWLLPVQNGDVSAPSQAFVYGITTNSWTIYDFGKEISYVSFLTEYSSEPILATYDGYICKITDSVKADQFYAYDATAGKPILTDTIITGELITRDFIVDSMTNLDRIERMVFEAQSENDTGEDVTISVSKNYGDTWVNVTDVDLTSKLEEREYWLDSVQKHLRFKFEFTNYFLLRYMYLSGLKRDRDSKQEGS